MKSVGQQLKEARLARNWTPELAARETKIKPNRIRDLEADDYANFSSPTYARGFVRTYARALGLDEYRILRQLDNKLPEDDNASFSQDDGSMPYVPEPSTHKMQVSSAPRTGLYVVLGLGVAVTAVIAFVLLQAYRAGELQRYFASTAPSDSIGSASTPVPDTDAPPHAVAVDPVDTSHSRRALPVDLNALGAAPEATGTNGAPAAPAGAPASVASTAHPAPPAASPDVADTATPAPAAGSSPAVMPSPATTSGSDGGSPVAASDPAPAVTTPIDPAAVPADPGSTTESTSTKPAGASDSPATSGEKALPRALPVDPRDLVAANQNSPDSPIDPSAQTSPAMATTAPIPAALNSTPNAASLPVAAPVDTRSPKNLILTASHDSTLRVTSLDNPGGRQVLYDNVLHKGQSLEFDGRKFSVNVGVPSAVDIMLDGVYYGPHSDGAAPETFTVESHHP